MKRRGSPADVTKSKRTRVSQSTSSGKRAVSTPKSDSSSHAETKHFDSVDADRLRESSLPWEILSDNLPGAEVFYLPNFLSEETADKIYAEVKELDTWYHPTLKVYGKSIVQSRAIAAYSTTPDLVVKYSGQTVDVHYPYPPSLAKLQCDVERVLGLEYSAFSEVGRDDDCSRATTRGFNHLMLNRYDDGTIYIGRHRDVKENNVIASLSLGAERAFIMTPSKKISGAEPLRLTLGNGSLLIMQGDTQNNWKHEIPKEPKIKRGRISLTFRQMQ